MHGFSLMKSARYGPHFKNANNSLLACCVCSQRAVMVTHLQMERLKQTARINRSGGKPARAPDTVDNSRASARASGTDEVSAIEKVDTPRQVSFTLVLVTPAEDLGGDGSLSYCVTEDEPLNRAIMHLRQQKKVQSLACAVQGHGRVPRADSSRPGHQGRRHHRLHQFRCPPKLIVLQHHRSPPAVRVSSVRMTNSSPYIYLRI